MRALFSGSVVRERWGGVEPEVGRERVKKV